MNSINEIINELNNIIIIEAIYYDKSMIYNSTNKIIELENLIIQEEILSRK